MNGRVTLRLRKLSKFTRTMHPALSLKTVLDMIDRGEIKTIRINPWRWVYWRVDSGITRKNLDRPQDRRVSPDSQRDDLKPSWRATSIIPGERCVRQAPRKFRRRLLDSCLLIKCESLTGGTVRLARFGPTGVSLTAGLSRQPRLGGLRYVLTVYPVAPPVSTGSGTACAFATVSGRNIGRIGGRA